MRPLKAGPAVLITLAVIVSLASAAAADGGPEGAQNPWHEAEGLAGDAYDENFPHGFDGLRCKTAARTGLFAEPLPTGHDARAAACGEPAGEGEKPQTPDVPEPALPDEGQVIADAATDLAALQRDAQGALDGAEDEARNLLDWLLEPVSGLGHEAMMLAQQTADTFEHLTAATVAQVQRAVDTGVAVLGALLRLVGETLDPPTGATDDSNGQYATQADATVATPLQPAAKAMAGAVIAGGIGLALAAFVLLRRLLGLGGIALLSRIPAAEIMKNETRSQVHEIVKCDPGVSLNEIVTRVGISRNAVAYHLAVFESEDIMTSIKDGKYRRYFINGGKYANGAKDVVSTIKNKVTRNVIRFITANPGAIQKDVCEAVGTSPSATSWHIRRLERVGLVEKERVANMVRYRPGPAISKYDLSDFGLERPTDAPAAAPAPVGPAPAPVAVAA